MTNKSTAREEFESEVSKWVGKSGDVSQSAVSITTAAIMTAANTFIESIAVETEQPEEHPINCFGGTPCDCGADERNYARRKIAKILRSHKST